MTCPKALTPLSVLPHLEYSHPSQLISASGDPMIFPSCDLGNISFVFTSALHSSPSIVGKGVLLLAWCSNPLYFCPKYANFSAIRRVVYLLGSKTRACRGFTLFEVDLDGLASGDVPAGAVVEGTLRIFES